ncbi:MAG: hypothetical protein J5852_07995, partial [Clostridia bacterium]|nr:hypothetical protein [Clostridia bacterium]
MRKRVKKEKAFGGFYIRALVCYFLVLCLLLSCILRVAVIKAKGYDEVCTEQIELKIKVARVRGTIYDCNMIPLTNNEKGIVAAVAPTPGAVTALSGQLSSDDTDKLLSTLRSGKPGICEVGKAVEGEGIAWTEIYKTKSGRTACHVIGYLDNTGHGAAGLEGAYDGLLYSDEYITAVISTDGKGNMLAGSQPRFENKSTAQANGVVSTIDVNIQNRVSKAAESIEKGAVVVAEAKTGEIKALVSLPQFDTGDISAALENSDSPLLNRALTPYSVGSIFKPCVAAAGIENGMGDFVFNCTGSTYIIDRYFKCHKLDGHGTVGLRQALAFSCNCYFYNFAGVLGGEAIYKAARNMMFGSGIKIAEGIRSAAGTLPEISSLKNPANLANFSIGQGELSASPVAMLPLYMAIANGGRYYLPSLVKSTITGGEITEYDKGYPTVCMSEETAEALKNYLKDVITEGTAVTAAPKTVTAAG